MTSRQFDAESLLRFAKKVSFPAILAIPLLGGVVAVTWSTAETAQALVEPAGTQPADHPAAENESAPGTTMPDVARQRPAPAPEASETGSEAPAAAPLETSATEDAGLLQEAALPPQEEAAELPEEAEAATVVRAVTVSRGDTLMGLLVDAGADRVQAHQAVTAMEPVYSARRLMPGQELTIAFADLGDETPGALLAINFSPNREHRVRHPAPGGPPARLRRGPHREQPLGRRHRAQGAAPGAGRGDPRLQL